MMDCNDVAEAERVVGLELVGPFVHQPMMPNCSPAQPGAVAGLLGVEDRPANVRRSAEWPRWALNRRIDRAQKNGAV